MTPLLVTFASVAVFVVVESVTTHRRAERRRTRPVTARIERVSRRHRRASGLVVEVLWPVAVRGWSTVGMVTGREPRRWWGSKHLFSRSPLDWRRVVWVPLDPGRHRVRVSDWRGRHIHEHEVVVDLDPGEHVLVTCWPAKRGVITPPRPETVWRVRSLGAA